MRKLFAAVALGALAGCVATPTPPAESSLWLPLPATMRKIESLDFGNRGPETAVLLPQAPYRLTGDARVPAGRTARITWTASGYRAELLP